MRDREYCIGCGLVRAGSAQQRCARCGNVEFLSLDSMIAYLYGCVWSPARFAQTAQAAKKEAEREKPFEKEKQR